jgi:DNA-binding response OmpR family regulator
MAGGVVVGETVKPETRRSVLVVDDDPVLGNMFLDVLDMAGHASEIARTGTEALALLRCKPFDLVISDLRMPLMSGQELWERIKPEHPDLAASMIFVSAEQPEAASCRFLKETGHIFLRKPFDIRELLRLIEKTATACVGRLDICA